MLPANPLFHKPTSIIAAKNILYASLFLTLINWTIAHFTTDPHLMSPAQQMAELVLTLLIVFTLTKLITMGKKWARIVLLAFFLLSMAAASLALPATLRANILLGVLDLLLAILQVLALYYLFARTSTQWFDHIHAFNQNEPKINSAAS
jgi:hypothetical protein